NLDGPESGMELARPRRDQHDLWRGVPTALAERVHRGDLDCHPGLDCAEAYLVVLARYCRIPFGDSPLSTEQSRQLGSMGQTTWLVSDAGGIGAAGSSQTIPARAGDSWRSRAHRTSGQRTGSGVA